MDSQTGTIKDKFLAGIGVLVLLACYMALVVMGADTKFIENVLLFLVGVFGGLLKQSPAPQTTVAESQTTNVNTGS